MGSNNIESDWEEQLADYALGVMDSSTASEFERKLNECIAHVELAQQYTQAVGMLGLSVASVEPPVGHKSRFMAKLAVAPREAFELGAVGVGMVEAIASEQAHVEPTPIRAHTPFTPDTSVGQASQDTPKSNVVSMAEYRERRQLPRMVQTLGALAAAFLIMVGFLGWWNAQAGANSAITSGNQASQQLKTLQAENEQLRGQLSTITAEKQKSDAAAAALRNTFNVPADYVPFSIAGQGDASGSTAVAFVSSRTNEVRLFATDLPRLGSNEVYEAWWIPPGFPNAKPLPAGTFNANQTGTATHETTSPAPVASFAAIAITREPAPGGDAPAGPIVMLGKYQLP